MYKVDIENKKLLKIPSTKFSSLNLKERFDIQEWIEKSPEILGEELLIISKELILPSGKRLDLLAIDKKGDLVVIELKRDDSGSNVEWQAIKYTSYCSGFSTDEIIEYYAKYLSSDNDDAHERIEEFIDTEFEDVNQKQRIILVSMDFHSEVISSVLWLLEYSIDIECIRLTPHLDGDDLYINPDIIIPLPEARTYIEKKATKQIIQRQSGRSSFSLEKSNYSNEELKKRIIKSLTRKSDLTPRLVEFISIIIQEDRKYSRDEIKSSLYESGVGSGIGQAGRYLSNISQFITKKSNPHLRQVIEFDSGESHGETKDNYHIITKYRDLVQDVLSELSSVN